MDKKAEELNNLDEQKYELIVCILNKGSTDLAINAAKSKGATGGTVFQARGTGNKEVGKFYGIDIVPEKEVLLIVVKKELSDEILKAMYEAAGLDTVGAGIIFTLPIHEVVGLTDANKLNFDKF